MLLDRKRLIATRAEGSDDEELLIVLQKLRNEWPGLGPQAVGVVDYDDGRP